MKTIDQQFIEKFKLDQLTIKKVGSWIISLRPQQPTVGSLILTLNRYCEKLSEINFNEAQELESAFKEIERLLDVAFKPDKINYLALMMVDNQVHFHVIPRYEKKVHLNSNEYTDTEWPSAPSLKPLDISKEELYEILYILNKNK